MAKIVLENSSIAKVNFECEYSPPEDNLRARSQYKIGRALQVVFLKNLVTCK
jgi:hypothetical protein